MPLRALARVNLAAIERNVARLRSELSSGAELCAVVKADGYGHGAGAAARAAVAGGARWLAVATALEAAELRAAGIRPPPRQFAIILLGGLRELIATTVEDGGSIGDITEVAVEATTAMLGPRSGPG